MGSADRLLRVNIKRRLLRRFEVAIARLLPRKIDGILDEFSIWALKMLLTDRTVTSSKGMKKLRSSEPFGILWGPNKVVACTRKVVHRTLPYALLCRFLCLVLTSPSAYSASGVSRNST